MTNVLFLIGNGFDLNIGLKTNFKNVLDEYLALETEDGNIKEFQEEIKKSYKNWASFEEEMGKYTEKFDLANKHLYLSQIDSFRNVLRRKFTIEENRIDYTSNKNENISVFVNSLANFQNHLSHNSKSALVPFMPISSRSLSRSITLTYNFMTFNYTNVLDKCVELIKEKDKPHFSIQSYANKKLIINGILGEILHIHGTLQSPFIIGVDNIKQIKNSELSADKDFQWNIVKPIINKELEEGNDTKAIRMINNSSIICVFGMSIGVTDMTWWKHIFSWLESDLRRHLVIFYHDENIDETNTSAIIGKKKNVKNLFFSVAGVEDEKKMRACQDRMHIAKRNGNMFKMNILFLDETSRKQDDLFYSPIGVDPKINPEIITNMMKNPILKNPQKTKEIVDAANKASKSADSFM